MKLNQKNIVLHPIQDKFVYGNWKYGGYFGEFGNGKTLAGILRSIRLSTIPNNTGIILRKIFADLRDTTLASFHEYFPNLKKFYNETKHAHIFPNGAIIRWRGIDRIGTIERLKNYDIGWFWIEQAEEVLEEAWHILCGRLKKNVKLQSGWITANPAGHNWCWKLFIGPYKNKEYEYFQPPARWNAPNLPKGYYEEKERMWPKAMVDRFLNGLHEGYEGLIYDCFSTEKHVKIINMNGNVDKVFEAQDYGISNTSPMVWLWVAKLKDNTYYVFDEYYKYNAKLREVSSFISAKRLTMQFQIMATYGCPRTFHKEKDGLSPADYFRKNYGIIIRPYYVNFEVRYPILYNLFKANRLFISPKCTNLINEISKYVWENYEKNDFHAIEALERLCAKLEITHVNEKKEKVETKEDKEMFNIHKKVNIEDVRNVLFRG